MVKGNNIKNLLFGIIVVLVLLTVCITVDYADDNITIASNKTVENRNVNASETILVNGTHYSIDNETGTAKLQNVVTEKPKYPIIGMWAKPSCGCNHRYTWHYREFINYCPNCGHYGTLRRNPKGVPENEYTCSRCSSDWCGVCGKEKMSYSKKYLRRL